MPSDRQVVGPRRTVASAGSPGAGASQGWPSTGPIDASPQHAPESPGPGHGCPCGRPGTSGPTGSARGTARGRVGGSGTVRRSWPDDVGVRAAPGCGARSEPVDLPRTSAGTSPCGPGRRRGSRSNPRGRPRRARGARRASAIGGWDLVVVHRNLPGRVDDRADLDAVLAQPVLQLLQPDRAESSHPGHLGAGASAARRHTQRVERLLRQVDVDHRRAAGVAAVPWVRVGRASRRTPPPGPPPTHRGPRGSGLGSGSGSPAGLVRRPRRGVGRRSDTAAR